jgi:hypothetical protein
MENFLKDDELELWKKFLDGNIILIFNAGFEDRYNLYCYKNKVYHSTTFDNNILDLEKDKSHIERLALVVIFQVLDITLLFNFDFDKILKETKTKCKDGNYLELDCTKYYITDNVFFDFDLVKGDMDTLIFELIRYETQGYHYEFTKI